MPLCVIGQITPSVPKWVSDIGGSGSCITSYLRVDAQNNTYVTGIFEGTIDFDPSPGNFNLTAGGGFDAFVAKYDPNGNLIWAKPMGGSGTDQPSGMDLDNNGNVTIVGQFNSPMDANPGGGTFSLNNAADFDMFIINLDANGNFLWAKSIGGSGADYGNKVAIDKDGNRIMIGQFQQTVQAGTATYSTTGTFNGLIAKYDAAGSYLWSFSLGATGDNRGVGIETDNNKDIIISGAFSGTVNFNPLGASYNLSSPGTASYIAKYTSSGQLIWVKVINGNTATNIAVDRSSNNIFATGTYLNATFDSGYTLNAAAGQAMFIARYAPNGSFIWAKGVDGSNASVTNNGITVKNDNVYISGYFNGSVDFDGSAGLAMMTYHGQRDLFLLKYNVDGDYQWAVTAGNNSCSNTLGRAVGIDSNNEVLFSGTFCSTVNFDVSGCTTYNLTAQSATRDGFLAKYTPAATGLANNQLVAPAITSFCGPFDPLPIQGSTPTGGTGSYTYQWQRSDNGINFTDIAGATAKDYDPSILTATTYFRRIVSSGTCNLASGSNVVQMDQQNTLANNTITAPSVIQFCGNGDPDFITGSTPTGGNGSYTFQWQSSVNGSDFTDIGGATSKDYDPPVINSTIYYRRKVVSGSCETFSNTLQMMVQPAISTNTITPQSGTNFCVQGDPAIISGNIPPGAFTYLYQWQSSMDNIHFSDIAGAVSNNYDPPLISATTYFRRIVSSAVCVVPFISNVVTIQVDAALAGNTITAPAIVAFCSTGDPEMIAGSTPTGGSGTYVYQWQISIDGVVYNDINGATAKDYNPPVITATRYFRRLVTSGACNIPQNSNNVTITVDILPTITLQSEVTICVGSGTTLNATGGNSNTTYQWLPSTGLSSTNSSNPTASPSVTTVYTLIATNGSCSNTYNTTVTVIPKPTVNAGSDKVIVKGNTVLLDAVTTGENLQYSWTPALYLDNPNIANPKASPPEDISYTLTVTSANNCFIVFDDVFVKVYPAILPPTAFTPNGDGVNDIWEIPGLNAYKGSVVSIFNRNGMLLRQITGNSTSWDGTHNGKLVPVGAYYYTIDLKNNKPVLAGWVTIVK